MHKGLLCREDILQGVRKSALTENMDEIETVYMERNGEITAIKNKGISHVIYFHKTGKNAGNYCLDAAGRFMPLGLVRHFKEGLDHRPV